jgi:hypothetical protein
MHHTFCCGSKSTMKQRQWKNTPVQKHRRWAVMLHLPRASLTIYQREFFYSGIKIFNALPMTIKDTSGNPKKFKVALKHYLLTHSFYNLDGFFSEQNT